MIYLHAITKNLELSADLLLNDKTRLLDIFIPTGGRNIFCIHNLLNRRSQCSLDMSISKFRISWRISDGLLATVIKGNDNTKHANSLHNRTGEIIISECILSKEIFTNELGNFHDNFLILRQGLLTNKLHNLRKIVLHLQNITALVTEVSITRIHLIKVRLENLHVLRVRNQPIKRWEMFTLGKLLVETPEHLHDRKGGCSHWIREIPTGRRHCSNNRHRTLTIR
mmetsp:Transcript_11038/g.24343  ORF Transcript_11038/g.24343 Transcript_11038/m.24343 type:complete len:225 (+) Transcript_11038:100-774(+)